MPQRLHRSFHPLRKHRSIVTSAVLLGLGVMAVTRPMVSVMGATYTWDAGGTNSNLGTAANWQGNAAPPDDGTASVVFTDSLFTASADDLQPNLEADYLLNAMTFAGGSSFTVFSNGNHSLSLGAGGLTQNSTAAQTVSVPVSLTADQTWTLASGAGALTFNNGNVSTQGHGLTLSVQGTNTLSAGISGTGGLAVNGMAASTLTLLGASTYTGETVVNRGTLAIDSGGSVDGSKGLYIVPGASFTLGGTASFSSGEIDVLGRLNQTGGTLTTGGSLFRIGYSGTYTLTGGNLSAGDFQVNAISYGNANQNGGTLTVTGAFVAGGDAATGTYTLKAGTASVGQIELGVQGTGIINQQGGSLTVNNGALYLGYQSGMDAKADVEGMFNLSAGNLSTGQVYVGYAANATGTFAQSGGTFTTNGSMLFVGYNNGSDGTYGLSNTGSLTTGLVFVGYSGVGTVNQSGGTVSTNANGFYLGYNSTGNGTYNLSGNGSLSTGTAVIGANGKGTVNQTGGTFTTNGNSLLLAGTGSTGTYNLGGGTLTVGGVSGASGTSAFNFNGGTLQAASASSTFFGSLTMANVQKGGAVFDTNGVNVTVTQALLHDTTSGAPALDGGLSKVTGNGTLTLTGANTYTGPTVVSRGTLQAGVASAAKVSGPFGLNSALSLANDVGVAVDLNDFNVQVGSLSGGGTKGGNVTLGSATLTVGSDNTSPAAYGGVISGTGSLVKTGTGTLTLAGANTFPKGTQINGGVLLAANSSGSSATGSGAVAVAGSGTLLGGTGFVAGDVTISSGAGVLGGNGTAAAGTLTMQGALTLNASSFIELVLGPKGAHSTLARTGTGAWTFASGQAFTFVNAGAQPGLYDNIITGLSADPGGESKWMITGTQLQGAFTYDGKGDIDLTLTTVPESATWLGAALLLGVTGLSLRRRQHWA